MIRATLVDLTHECASGETPCGCPMYALMAESGDVEHVQYIGAGCAQRAIERMTRKCRQREGRWLFAMAGLGNCESSELLEGPPFLNAPKASWHTPR